MNYLVPWLTTLIFSLGYLGLAILVALGNIRLVPIPAEITLPLAGLLVGEGQLTFVPVLLWTTVASVIVSVILYLLGFWVGEDLRGVQAARWNSLSSWSPNTGGNGSNFDTGGHRADAHLWEVHELHHPGHRCV